MDSSKKKILEIIKYNITVDESYLIFIEQIIFNRNEEAIKLLNENNFDLTYAFLPLNETPLIIACNSNNKTVALAIIKKGNCNPSHVNYYNYTALMLACMLKTDEVALAIIDSGEDYNVSFINDIDNSSASVIAINYKLYTVLNKIIENGYFEFRILKDADKVDYIQILNTTAFNNKNNYKVLLNGSPKTAISAICKNDILKYNEMIEILSILNAKMEILNPWFIQNKPHLPEPIPTIEINHEAFDAIQHEYIPIKEAIKEDVFIIQTTNNNNFIIHRKDLKQNLYELIHYPCNNINSLNSEISVQFLLPLVYLVKLGLPFFCPLINILNMLQSNNVYYALNPTPYEHMYIDNNSNKSLFEKYEKKQLPSVASVVSEVFFNTQNAMSASHCQAGNEQYVYDFIPVHTTDVESPNKKARDSQSVMEQTFDSDFSNFINVRIHVIGTPEKIIKILITSGMTFQNVAEQIESQYSETKPFKITRFIHGGKIYGLNQIVESKNEEVFQAVVKVLKKAEATVTGGKIRKNRNKTRKTKNKMRRLKTKRKNN